MAARPPHFLKKKDEKHFFFLVGLKSSPICFCYSTHHVVYFAVKSYHQRVQVHQIQDKDSVKNIKRGRYKNNTAIILRKQTLRFIYMQDVPKSVTPPFPAETRPQSVESM
jgi:hypothetical protein